MFSAQEIVFMQHNPPTFFRQILGVDSLEPYQEKILKTIAKNERTSIAACHNVGKSWTLGRVVLWFCSVYPGSKVITTAPTYNQVKNILWSEIRAAYSKSKIPLGGVMNLTEWKLGDDHFAIGFTPKNEVNGEAGQGTQSSFQGFHAPYLLVVLDEATGIPKNIWRMVEGMLTSANVKFLAIGNPTSINSEFFECFKSRDWAKVYLSCFDSPNFKANNIFTEDDLKNEVEKVRHMSDDEASRYLQAYKNPKAYMLTVSWCVRNILKWGFEHPLTQSKILGKFPEESDNSLVSLGMVEAAQLRVYYPEASDRKLLGIDVARFGADSTVMTSLHGYKFEFRKSFQKKDIAELTGIAIAMIKENNFDVVTIDETGLGGGLVDNLKAAQREGGLSRAIEIRGVQFGASCRDESDKERFVNLKARMFKLLGEDLKEKLTLSDDSVYLEELPSILYKYDTKGRTYIESKDDYKKRTGRSSPDSADSLALANYGRYDEIKVASFTSAYTNTQSTIAGGLNRGNEW
jgi:hypothetical protein